MSVRPKPVVLTILDGWGYRAETENNAIALARKPTYDKLMAEFPNTLIRAAEHFVGLPDGQMGNSEVGHLNLGAGRVVMMDITRLDAKIANGEFYSDPQIVKAIEHAKKNDRALHLFGLVSDGGVHSHQNHLYALLKAARQHGLSKVYVHAFMDGRDTLPTSGAGYLEALQKKMSEYQVGQIATVSGRYYAMDRDRRWEREKLAFDAMVKGQTEGGAYQDPVARVRECYSNDMTDEFIVPFVVTDEKGHPVGKIEDEDACIMFNFRADRARQITRVLARNSGLSKEEGRDLPGAEPGPGDGRLAVWLVAVLGLPVLGLAVGRIALRRRLAVDQGAGLGGLGRLLTGCRTGLLAGRRCRRFAAWLGCGLDQLLDPVQRFELSESGPGRVPAVSGLRPPLDWLGCLRLDRPDAVVILLAPAELVARSPVGDADVLAHSPDPSSAHQVAS